MIRFSRIPNRSLGFCSHIAVCNTMSCTLLDSCLSYWCLVNNSWMLLVVIGWNWLQRRDFCCTKNLCKRASRAVVNCKTCWLSCWNKFYSEGNCSFLQRPGLYFEGKLSQFWQFSHYHCYWRSSWRVFADKVVFCAYYEWQQNQLGTKAARWFSPVVDTPFFFPSWPMVARWLQTGL